MILTPPPFHLGMKGFFKMETFRAIETPAGPVEIKGTRRTIAPWQPNKILTSGRNYIGSAGAWMDYCQVGTGSTPPTSGDTGLENWLTGTNNVYAESVSAQASTPYYGWKRKTWRFNPGTATGNISEAGVGWNSSGSTLFSRTLIIDGAGNPTTATVLPEEYLDVTYELRYYPPAADILETTVINGITYDLVTRAADVTSSTHWGAVIGSQMGQYSAFNSDWSAYDGAIGTVDQSPSGLTAACDNDDQYNNSYANNSYQRTMNCSCGFGGWNLAAGIRSIRFRTTGGSYQTQFTAQGSGDTIPKTDLVALNMSWTIGWAEYIIP